jgi:hypothetical protein
MDKLDPNVLSIVLKFVPQESVNILSASSHVLFTKINKLEDDQFYWKIRVESLLNKEISEIQEKTFEEDVNWEIIYKILVNSIGEYDPIYIAGGYYRTIKADLSDFLNVENIIKNVGYDRPDDYEGIMESSKEGIMSVARLLNSLTSPIIVNNDAFLNMVRDKHTDIANLLYVENRVNLSTIDQYELFRAMAKLNNTDTLKKILDNPIDKFNKVNVLTGAALVGTVEFNKILINDGRFSSAYNEALNISTSNGNIPVAHLFMAEPNVRILPPFMGSSPSTLYKKEKILIPYIQDSFGGLIAMYAAYGSGLPITSYITKGNNNLLVYYQRIHHGNKLEVFYNNFLGYLFVKNPRSMIDIVKQLTEEITKHGSPDIKDVIYKSVKSIIDPISVHYNNNEDMFFAFRAFFMLSYVDSTGNYFYTYKDILEKIKKEGASPAAITLAAKLIGSKMGLIKLKADGLVVSASTEKEINDQLDNIDPYDLSHW